MMENFEEFLEKTKKIEIEDEKFKEELKRKLFELYDRRYEKRRAIFLKRAISFAIIVLVIIIPSFILYKNIISPKMEITRENNFLLKNIESPYEETIKKFIKNDEIIYQKEENGFIKKIYKSGIVITEKDGEFNKIIYNEEYLKENKINIEDYIVRSTKVLQNYEMEFLDKIFDIIKKDERFDFIKRENVENIENIGEENYIVKILGDRGYWILILNLNENKIKFFSYPN